MSEKKKYLVKAAESRKRQGGIWRLQAFWRYGQWTLVELSDEAAAVLQADWDIDIEEYTSQKVEFTTELTVATNPPESDMVGILFNTDYDEKAEAEVVEEKPKSSRKKKTTKTQEE